MTNPQNNASSGGCFSGIARLLLCKGSLQTHPSDQLTDFPNKGKTDHHHHHYKFGHSKTEKIEANVVEATVGPGVVARLMGLESLPDTNWVPKGRSPDSVPRSRSVNFMDNFLEFDLEQAQHRRARTSVSFREVPTLLTQENNECFVVYLDNLEKSRKQHGQKQRKSELSPGDMKQKNEVKNKNNEKVVRKYEKKQINNNRVSNIKDKLRRTNTDRNVSKLGTCRRSGQVSSSDHMKEVKRRKSRESSPSKRPVKSINRKEELTESKLMKKIKNQRTVRDTQSECSSEDSSPVSVLSLSDVSVYEPTPSLPDYPRPVDSSSMKKGSSTTSSTTFPLSHPIHTSNKKNEQSENDENSSYYIEYLVTKLCMLTEKELRMSSWIAKNAALEFELCEEMCMEFEQQIVDVLLLQIVEDLAEC